jgi:hypothetical protein
LTGTTAELSGSDLNQVRMYSVDAVTLYVILSARLGHAEGDLNPLRRRQTFRVGLFGFRWDAVERLNAADAVTFQEAKGFTPINPCILRVDQIDHATPS